MDLLVRAANYGVERYLRQTRIQRGKSRLLRWASRFLVVELEPGVFVRISEPNDPMEQSVAFGWIERDEAAALMRFLAPGMVMLDIGANMGLYSLLAAKRVGPTGSVHAFEPNPRVAEKFRVQTDLNAFSNISINDLAVSDYCGEAAFFLHHDHDRSSLAAVSQTSIRVSVSTLDTWALQNGINRVDVLKIDVEGAERNVLNGAMTILERDHPVIMIEINPSALESMGASTHDVFSPLEGLGYSLTEIAAHPGYSNYLAQYFAGDRSRS